MSTADTMTPLVSAPWVGANGKALPVRTLPGLRPEVIQGLESSFPGIISPTYKALLATCCGLAETEIGSIDFSGCLFPEEPCGVFQPCLTLAIDDAGRRWIGEVGERDLPGPIWCVFPDPKVAVYVSDDLPAFMATLRRSTSRGETLRWLQDLSIQARTVWSRRHALARRPYELHDSDKQIRGWLAGLPFDAYVYDLRAPTIARGWPYGLAGPSGRRVETSLTSRHSGIVVSRARCRPIPCSGQRLGEFCVAKAWAYGPAHERNAQKARGRQALPVGVVGRCAAVWCDVGRRGE
jgi:hypothetical protein